jgi:hypothetical protein
MTRLDKSNEKCNAVDSEEERRGEEEQKECYKAKNV